MDVVLNSGPIRAGEPFPRLVAVAPAQGFRVAIAWEDGSEAIVDLAPNILLFKVYRPLREDRSLFESVHLVDATTIAWGEDDAIDMHASEIARLAG